MALAWKAGKVQAFVGSNPTLSAARYQSVAANTAYALTAQGVVPTIPPHLPARGAAKGGFAYARTCPSNSPFIHRGPRAGFGRRTSGSADGEGAGNSVDNCDRYQPAVHWRRRRRRRQYSRWRADGHRRDQQGGRN